ncbi:MAG: beta-phosphoglucomutase [Bacteroidota bacterium]
MGEYRGAAFDLDGVIVDTAKYHFLAWQRLARELGIEFTERDNERLKGVSRMRSLAILLEIGGLTRTEAEMQSLAETKNRWYVEYINGMDASEILPGAREYLHLLRRRGIKTALCSASKNAGLILAKLQIAELFDAVIDGNKATKAKPDPEIFLMGAAALGLDPGECVAFEDAAAGVEAAKRAGMYTIGVGDEEILKAADLVISGLHELLPEWPNRKRIPLGEP